jgi:hypothetical protein
MKTELDRAIMKKLISKLKDMVKDRSENPDPMPKVQRQLEHWSYAIKWLDFAPAT